MPDSTAPIQPENMAHISLGDHGLNGMKLTAQFILDSKFNTNDMRMP